MSEKRPKSLDQEAGGEKKECIHFTDDVHLDEDRDFVTYIHKGSDRLEEGNAALHHVHVTIDLLTG